MKVKPMINGIEVKVGQVWSDMKGNQSVIESIGDNGEIFDNLGFIYARDGSTIGGYLSNYSLTCMVRDVESEATFTESEINAKINQVIKEFDWQRAFSVYNALNWTWYTTQGIPTIGDLVVSGIENVKQAVQIAVANQDEGYVSSGGLIGRAYITDGKLAVSLEMQVTEAISGY